MGPGNSLVGMAGPWADLGLSLGGMVLLIGLALAFSSYVKIATVLGIVRIGLGFASLPSAFVTGALALTLTFFVMYPSMERASLRAETMLRSKGPANVNSDVRLQVLNDVADIWKEFVRTHTNSAEIERFSRLLKDSGSSATRSSGETVSPTSVDSDSWRVLAPAFLVGELKSAFATGLMLYLPFLVVELLVAHLLIALGAQNLQPAYVSFPFKLLLFVLADGWGLIAGNVVKTYL